MDLIKNIIRQQAEKILSNQKAERNAEFSFLQAVAILMVVLSHNKSAIGLFDDWFWYSSFYMQLFVFISGYFFNFAGGGIEISFSTKQKDC